MSHEPWANWFERNAIRVCKLLVTVWICAMFFGCGHAVDIEKFEDVEAFQEIEINGMPCITVTRAIAFKGYFGITCDWSKYKGGDDDMVIHPLKLPVRSEPQRVRRVYTNVDNPDAWRWIVPCEEIERKRGICLD